jgi:hypothetical protein
MTDSQALHINKQLIGGQFRLFPKQDLVGTTSEGFQVCPAFCHCKEPFYYTTEATRIRSFNSKLNKVI